MGSVHFCGMDYARSVAGWTVAIEVGTLRGRLRPGRSRLDSPSLPHPPTSFPHPPTPFPRRRESPIARLDAPLGELPSPAVMSQKETVSQNGFRSIYRLGDPVDAWQRKPSSLPPTPASGRCPRDDESNAALPPITSRPHLHGSTARPTNPATSSPLGFQTVS